MAGRWLEFLNKDSGKDALPAGGVAFDYENPPATLRIEPADSRTLNLVR